MLHNTKMKIFTSSTACSFFFFLFFFFSLDHEFSSSAIADRITSRMAFNIFLTSINICSLARYFFFVSFSSYGNRESSSTLCVDPHAHPHACFHDTHTHTHMPARLNIHTYECVEANRRETEGDFLGLFYGRENKVLPNVGKHGVVFARPVKRSVSRYHWPVCTHTHRNVSVCVIQCVRRMTPEIACLFAARRLSLGDYNKVFH